MREVKQSKTKQGKQIKMKEKEFIEKVQRLSLTYLDLNLGLEIPIYYNLDDKGNVLIDFESMQEEFENKLKEIDIKHN